MPATPFQPNTPFSMVDGQPSGSCNPFAAVHGTGTSRCVIPPSAERLDPLPKITISTPDIRTATPIYHAWYLSFGSAGSAPAEYIRYPRTAIASRGSTDAAAARTNE